MKRVPPNQQRRWRVVPKEELDAGSHISAEAISREEKWKRKASKHAVKVKQKQERENHEAAKADLPAGGQG
jgi:hypothetical protein